MDIKQALSIPRYADFHATSIGLDSEKHCFNLDHFRAYPDAITYEFNELGFRDCSYLKYASTDIIAIGDSFTLGLGVNAQQTWPARLAHLLDHPVRNFSLNGASNDWMARKIQKILEFFSPPLIIVHYTFSHRRERPFLDWHDDERTESEPLYTQQENMQNWTKAYELFANLSVPVIHSFIPNWDPVGVDHGPLGPNCLAPVQPQDLARDGFHYGPKTHAQLAQDLADITNLLAVGLHPAHGS